MAKKKIKVFTEKDGFYSLRHAKYHCPKCGKLLDLLPPCPGCDTAIQAHIDPMVYPLIEDYLKNPVKLKNKETANPLVMLVWDPVSEQVLYKKIDDRYIKDEYK